MFPMFIYLPSSQVHLIILQVESDLYPCGVGAYGQVLLDAAHPGNIATQPDEFHGVTNIREADNNSI